MLRCRHLVIALSLVAAVPVAGCENHPFIAEERVTFFIAPQQVDCVGAFPQKCLLVKHRAEEEWTYFYDPIAGFAYEPGFNYEVIVGIRRAPEPIPADAPAYQYRLIHLVAKTPAG
ncbi:MAG TPA: DUF4377 domain-containing protein [Longimicrobium sp.]|jgi:hypothetical protein